MAFNVVHWLKAFTDERSDWPCQYRMVALAIARHADSKTGNCYPSLRLLEREAGVSHHTVIRALRLLEQGGWCTRAPPIGAVSRYKLVSDVHQYPACTSAPETPVSDVHQGGAPETLGGGAPQAHEQPSINKPSNNPTNRGGAAKEPIPTEIDDAYIEAMIAKFSPLLGGNDSVRDEIANAMNHTAMRKRPNKRMYLHTWLNNSVKFRAQRSFPSNGRSNGHALIDNAEAHRQAAIEAGFDPDA